jgi:transglutaminase-like putative cysteine protease
MRTEAFALIVMATFAAPVGAQVSPLFVIPTESSANASISPSTPLRVLLTVHDPAKLAASLGINPPAGSGSFEYTVGAYPQVVGPANRTWLEPTFVIDFDQPEFAPLLAEMEKPGAKPTRARIVQFVADTIDEHVPRDWDLASTVAKKRQGDCSEHAVLTTAIARRQGIPARVVVGVALLSNGQLFNAYGHAWAEIKEDGRWVVADAAMLEHADNVRYIPMGLMEDEGMGYVMSLAGLSSQWIQNVKVLGPAE